MRPSLASTRDLLLAFPRSRLRSYSTRTAAATATSEAAPAWISLLEQRPSQHGEQSRWREPAAIPRKRMKVDSIPKDSATTQTQAIKHMEITRIDNPKSHDTIQRSIALPRLLKGYPDILNLIRQRNYRKAVFTILKEPELRIQEPLLDLIRTRIQKHAYRSIPPCKVQLDGALTCAADLGMVDLALRLGLPPSGYKRGPSWEALHYNKIHESGSLPSINLILQSIQHDYPAGSMAVGPAASCIPPAQVNTTLSKFLSLGSTAYDRFGHHISQRNKPHDPDDQQNLKDPPGPRPSSRYRPNPSGKQLDYLFSLMHQHVPRGFKPDKVTTNIILKCWLRSLEVDSPLPTLDEQGKGAKKEVMRKDLLVKLINHCYKTSLEDLRAELLALKNNPNSLSANITPSPSPPPDHLCKSPSRARGKTDVTFENIYKPLGKMLIKAAFTRGDRASVKKVDAWLRLVKETRLLKAGGGGLANGLKGRGRAIGAVQDEGLNEVSKGL